MILLSNSLEDGKKLAKKLGAKFCHMEEKIYPDSEKTLIIEPRIKKADIIYFKFHDRGASFDDQLFNLLATLRWFGDKKKTKLVLPYVPYCRSYLHLLPGEADKFGFMLEEIQKRVKILYVVAPHRDDFEAIARKFGLRARNIDIDDATIRHIRSYGEHPVLVSPDNGFSRNIMRIAKRGGFKYIVLSKKRISPREVVVTSNAATKKIILANKKNPFVVLDDIVSTGGTLVRVGAYLKSCGVKNIKYVTVHDTRGRIKTKVPVICSNSIMCEGKRSYDITDSLYRALKRLKN